MLKQIENVCRDEQGEFSIDTLTFSLDLSVLARGIENYSEFNALSVSMKDSGDNKTFTVLRYFIQLVSDLFPLNTLKLENEISRGYNFYNHSIKFTDKCGFIAFGGNNKHTDSEGNEKTSRERLTVHITGEGCRRLHDFKHLYTQLLILADFRPVITRIDMAFDDHDGFRGVDTAIEMYNSGEFNGAGRPPKATHISDMGSGDGSTFQVGSAKSGKTLVCYEKGKQLGDSSDPWVRWEGRLYAQDRLIPLDALIDYENYLVGLYPALEFMQRSAKVVKTGKKKEKIQYEHLKKHARVSYGPLINYMKKKGLSDEEIIRELVVSHRVPVRLEWTSFENDQVQSVVESRRLPYEQTHAHLFPKEGI